MNFAAAAVVSLWLLATYIISMNSSLAALIDFLMRTPACSFQMKRGASWSLEVLGFRKY
jgi:hypothetical protein